MWSMAIHEPERLIYIVRKFTYYQSNELEVINRIRWFALMQRKSYSYLTDWSWLPSTSQRTCLQPKLILTQSSTESVRYSSTSSSLSLTSSQTSSLWNTMTNFSCSTYFARSRFVNVSSLSLRNSLAHPWRPRLFTFSTNFLSWTSQDRIILIPTKTTLTWKIYSNSLSTTSMRMWVCKRLRTPQTYAHFQTAVKCI